MKTHEASRNSDKTKDHESHSGDFILSDYEPEKYAFRFSNNFINVYNRWWHPKIKTKGRCGGMCYASLDYYYSGHTVPVHTSPDQTESANLSCNHSLADYINERQWDSVLKGRGLLDGLKFILWSGINTEALVRKTEFEEIPKLRKSVASGNPVVLGLIRSTKLYSPQKNHQVVCYGYRSRSYGQTELLIYDPNEPFRTSAENYHFNKDDTLLNPYKRYCLMLSMRSSDSDFPYHSDRPSSTDRNVDRWRGFFVKRYSPKKSNLTDNNLIH